jgi:16S rRNA (cytidine1402-2'-O)-methyltransferase
MTEKNKVMPRTLYLVATPIGNLADLSERAVKVLSEVDFVAAEDTRNTAKLLAILGISRPMVSYHDHNRRERGPAIAQRLENGESCALVTDAGTPAVSDPGADLVVLCAERGVTVTSIPGCCAAITALTLSALPTGRFTFEGFLSTNKAERRAHLDSLKNEKRTMIFHEAPHKLRNTLSDLADAFGGSRRIALCRELTKLNEQVERTTLAGAMEIYTAKEPRGEYVLVIEGAGETAETSAFWQDMSIQEHVRHYVDTGMSEKDAIKAAAKDRGVHKNEVYSVVVEQKNAQK